MKSIKKDQSKRAIWVIIVVVAILLIGGSVFAISQGFLTDQPSSSQANDEDTITDGGSTIDNTPPTDDQTNAGNDIKKGSLDNDNDSSETPDTIDVSVTATPIDADTIHVQTIIQKVTNSGKCTLDIKKGSTALTYSSEVQASTKYSTCKGFTVNNLAPGTWTITLTYSSGSISAIDTTKVTL
jgi:hypothetical protein